MKKETVPKLMRKATFLFNRWIRKRDANLPCISCGRYTTLQAGHYYSAGHHPGLRYDPDNVHGQCVRCNLYLSGNLINYRNGLMERIGEERLVALDQRCAWYKKNRFKNNRYYLQEIIEKYK